MSKRMEDLIIVDALGDEVMQAAVDEDGKPTLLLFDFLAPTTLVPTTLDIGGVRALCDWLTAWLEQREAVQP